MKKQLKLLYNFFFKTRRRSLTLLTVFHMAVSRYRIKYFKGSELHKYLGTLGETPQEVELTKDQMRDLYFVADKVKRGARRVPWDSKCLVQAMTAQRLLKKYGIQSTLYLGVGRDHEKNGEMIAHAWVRVGKYFVCGGDGTGYGKVASFIM